MSEQVETTEELDAGAGEEGSAVTDTNGQGAGDGEGGDKAAEDAAGKSEDTEGGEEKAQSGDDKASEEDEKKSDDEDKSTGAPEAYEAFTVPKGMNFDGERLEQFQAFAKENDWDQATAQAAIDYYTKGLEEALVLQQDQWGEIKAGWRKEAEARPSLKAEDGTIDAAVARAKQAAEALGGPALIKAFDMTGVGEHPAVIEAFNELAKHTLEDGSFAFGNSSRDTRSREQRMFPNMK